MLADLLSPPGPASRIPICCPPPWAVLSSLLSHLLDGGAGLGGEEVSILVLAPWGWRGREGGCGDRPLGLGSSSSPFVGARGCLSIPFLVIDSSVG